jgi:hypothetical protein
MADSFIRSVHRRGVSPDRGVFQMLADLLTGHVDVAALLKELALAPVSCSSTASKRRDEAKARPCGIRGGKTLAPPSAIRPFRCLPWKRH